MKILVLLVLFGIAWGHVGGGKKVLVLMDSLTTKQTHSIFFKNLVNLGFELTFKAADDSSITLKEYGEFLFDHLLLFSPGVVEFGSSLTVQSIVEFIDAGGNVLAAGSDNTADALHDLASECGFEIDEEGTSVIDHMNFDVKDEGKHTLIVADPDNLIRAPKVVGERKAARPMLYRGTGLILDQENPLVMEILTASSSAYCHDPNSPITEYPHSTGKNAVLLAGLQARNNARVVFSGSLDFFSDAFFTSLVQKDSSEGVIKSGNEDIATTVALWCFKHAGVLRVKQVSHHLAKGEETPSAYTIMDDVVYTIDIEEYKDGKWVPFDGNDVQMEFHRIDPFVRLNLVNKKGKFEARFKLPDVYGVFQFKVDYLRAGFTRLFSSTQVSVRPLRHDQYERFIPGAYPYYASAFSMMVGVFLFSIVFLHFRDDVKTKHE